jgi:4-hydroxy-3-methylbut-2-enyl diphosphate reductase
MKVLLAETAGFCMGVDLALKKLDSIIEDHPDREIFTLGPIIHNPQVLAAYEGRGVKRIADPDQAPPNSVVVIRAHGVPLEVQKKLKERGITVRDATCPKVKKAQLLIESESLAGRQLLLFGEENHPEVRGLLSYCKLASQVFQDVEGLLPSLEAENKYFLAAQTTQDRSLFESIRDRLRADVDPDMPVLSTICDATKVRQQEAITIARQVDIMVVAGGYESGNTRRLAQVVRDQGVPCMHVEESRELRREDFADREFAGLTAGASTPDNTIAEIRTMLESF